MLQPQGPRRGKHIAGGQQLPIVRRYSMFRGKRENIILYNFVPTSMLVRPVSVLRVSRTAIYNKFRRSQQKQTNATESNRFTLCRESRGNALARHSRTPCVDLRGSSCSFSDRTPPCPARDTASGSFAARTHWHVSASRFARSPLEDPGEASRKSRNLFRRRRMTVKTSPASSWREKIYK